MKNNLYRWFFKPILDSLVSLFFLILLSPLLIIVTVLLTIANNGNAFFIQKRPGKNEKVFSIIKFKTMNDRRSFDGKLLPDEQRMTSIGRIIRKTSLDEIPQLINVILGQMSLVGPRPLLPEYLSLYNSKQKQRHSAKPGITGWAQINGRNAITWSEKFDLDYWYVHNMSFLLDIKIIMITIGKVIKSKDISSKSSVTMEAFNGKN